VAVKGKSRKENGKAEKPDASRLEPEQSSDLGMSDEIVRDFLVESNENLDLLDRELVKLEKDPSNQETLSSIFRTIHTIKGTKTPIKPRRKLAPSSTR
jgi:Hpt domain